MRNTSTRRFPRLERLLLDGDIDPELGDYLRAVGFNVRFAPRDNPIIEDDVKVLRLARRQNRILVCHDKHSDRSTRLRLYPEIYNRRGNILHIGGDSSQPLVTALGKVVVHYEHWSAWFKAHPNGGRVSVHSTKWSSTSAEKLMTRHMSHIYVGDEVPPIPPRRSRGPRPRRPSGTSEQLPLIE